MVIIPLLFLVLLIYFSYFGQHKSAMYNFGFSLFLYTSHIYIHDYFYYQQSFFLFFLSFVCIFLCLVLIVFVLLLFHLFLHILIFLLFYILAFYNIYLYVDNLNSFLCFRSIYTHFYQFSLYMVRLLLFQDIHIYHYLLCI